MLHDSAAPAATGLPHRGAFGAPRPPALATLALPPGAMPARAGTRPLKAWRYVAVFSPELMLCVASVRIGPVHQCFWAVWDRGARRLYERTRLGAGGVRLTPGRVQVSDGPVAIAIALDETAGIESICPSGHAYGWTRKQGGVPARGSVVVAGRRHELAGRAIVDDTAAYYARHTVWRWSAGVGTGIDGRALAWNLVEGVNDPPAGSERTVWVDGVPREAGPVRFASDLGAVLPRDGACAGLRFTAEATRSHHENRLLVRSRYTQPFGRFTGELAPGLALGEGLGVMEAHDVHW